MNGFACLECENNIPGWLASFYCIDLKKMAREKVVDKSSRFTKERQKEEKRKREKEKKREKERESERERQRNKYCHSYSMDS